MLAFPYFLDRFSQFNELTDILVLSKINKNIVW